MISNEIMFLCGYEWYVNSDVVSLIFYRDFFSSEFCRVGNNYSQQKLFLLRCMPRGLWSANASELLWIIFFALLIPELSIKMKYIFLPWRARQSDCLYLNLDTEKVSLLIWSRRRGAKILLIFYFYFRYKVLPHVLLSPESDRAPEPGSSVLPRRRLLRAGLLGRKEGSENRPKN